MQVAHAEDSTADRQHADRQGAAVQDAADRRGRRARQFPALFRPPAGRGRRSAPQAQFRSDPHVPGRRQAELRRGQMDRAGRDRLFPGRHALRPRAEQHRAAEHHAAVRRREPQRLHQLGARAEGHGRDEGVRHLREGHLQAHRPAGAGREAQPGQLRGDLGARQQAQARLSEAALRRADPDEAGELRVGAVGGSAGLCEEAALRLLRTQPAILDRQARAGRARACSRRAAASRSASSCRARARSTDRRCASTRRFRAGRISR